MVQATFDFDNNKSNDQQVKVAPVKILTTGSPINKEKFTGQNMTVYSHLQSGQTINVFIAITKYNIYHLHSRISDLRNKHKIKIYDRSTNVNGVSCNEYSLTPFTNI